jgi:hypothetical protein
LYISKPVIHTKPHIVFSEGSHCPDLPLNKSVLAGSAIDLNQVFVLYHSCNCFHISHTLLSKINFHFHVNPGYSFINESLFSLVNTSFNIFLFLEILSIALIKKSFHLVPYRSFATLFRILSGISSILVSVYFPSVHFFENFIQSLRESILYKLSQFQYSFHCISFLFLDIIL